MTATDAIRRTMSTHAVLSLMEIQKVLLDSYGITATDGSISRRLREMGAKHRLRKGTKHVNEYWVSQNGYGRDILDADAEERRIARETEGAK